MKILTLAVLLLPLLFVPACTLYQEGQAQRDVDQRLVSWYGDAAINNALISQRSLFPYHFVDQAADLNSLGQRDLAVLAAHLKDYPGVLNLRRGGAPDALYQARLATVRKALVDAGIDQTRIEIGEGMAGGDGMASEQVLRILKQEEKKAASSSAAGYSIDALTPK